MMIDSIVSVNWLNKNLDNPDLIIFDASLKKSRPNVTSESTIKKARYFDLKISLVITMIDFLILSLLWNNLRKNL